MFSLMISGKGLHGLTNIKCSNFSGQWSSAGEDDSHTSQPGLSFSRHKIFALDNLLGDNENPPEFVRHITSAR